MDFDKKKWADCSADEKKQVFDKLSEIQKELGYPKQIQDPVSNTEIVNVLMAGQQNIQSSLSIEGNFSDTETELLEKAKTAFGAVKEKVEDFKIELKVARGVGSQMGVIKDAHKLDSDASVNVEHEAGQVILLDFWATWCGPCQGPMAHNQKMLDDNKEKWGDKVRIIGLSIDSQKDELKSHVSKHGWTSVEHYHIRNGKCVADKEFSVRGVPHCALVDTTGKIRWIGHPATRKLEEDINKLLAGECPEGMGEAKADEEAKSEDAPADKSDLDVTKAEAICSEFAAKSKALHDDERIKEVRDKIPRGFLVLVNQTKLNTKQNIAAVSLKLHTVIMAPQDVIDKVKAVTEEISKADGHLWENVEQCRAM